LTHEDEEEYGSAYREPTDDRRSYAVANERQREPANAFALYKGIEFLPEVIKDRFFAKEHSFVAKEFIEFLLP